jgi:hypothetical protein
MLRGFQEALKPVGVLYITMDRAGPGELQEALRRARARGQPAVYGEVVDRVDVSLEQVPALGRAPIPEGLDHSAVYHFYPSLEQARGWIAQGGLAIEDEGAGSGHDHFLGRKPI